MSLLIKGMEAPVFEHQSWDIRHGADGKWYVVDTNAETSDGEWHEIVPISPHGRLIDADKLKADNPQHMNVDVPYVTEITVEEIIDEAPTVVEADE